MRDRPAPDVLDALLRHVRITASRYGRVELGAPWGMRVAARRTVFLHHLLEGELWLEVTGCEVHAVAGDLLILPHGAPHTLRHRPGAPVQDEAPAAAAGGLSSRLRYGGPGLRTVVLCAELSVGGAARGPLLRALPPVVHLPRGEREAVPGLTPLLDLLRDEIRASLPGAPLIASRLAEILLLKGIRAELDKPASPGSWRAALTDERIARSLDALYASPERPWTVTSLARVAGMSRTTFAARFRALVGDPPMTHLTSWRMELAKALLRDSPHHTLAEIAAAVGYADEFSFAAAFRREVGHPPGTHRPTAFPGTVARALSPDAG
ncbi:AraC family transcriptional regulator [Planomonospora sp. ID91781]|uniref:AraC family transcriptional regulator n=1 Tax=Planomonospora sp. ID91781 TaxID=2738135 RepID=UPI0018C3A1D4|nr:AraC family transcriptional regulator [Planomonospora sp. ID91781]MBG0822846.1 AraC family transcriptional regulator [Planomonospora sp. ID91781]